MSAARRKLLADMAASIHALSTSTLLRVAIDGVDGAGKSIFADELAEALAALGRPTIRASVDGFHNPRSIRYRQGRSSPEGFLADSYNYAQLRALLLDPLSPGGTRRYRIAAFDHRLDTCIASPERLAAAESILVFDGIFLHRPELRAYWDFSIFLDVTFDVSIPRGAQRGEGSADPNAGENRRYVEGQRIYLKSCEPRRHATVVVNHDDLASPYVVI